MARCRDGWGVKLEVVVSSRTGYEVSSIAKIKEKIFRLRSYLMTLDFDSDVSEIHLSKYLNQIKTIQGNINNDISLLATLLAKDYLLTRFDLPSLDFAEKPQGAPGLDIDLMTKNGKRVIAEIKSTVPYSGAKNDLGAQQKSSFLKDFEKLNVETADNKFFFVTDKKTYSIVMRKYKNQIPDVEVILLQVLEG